MANYSENTSTTLLQGASDPDGDALTVRSINGDLVTLWPYTVGNVKVYQNGVLEYVSNDSSNHPTEGQTEQVQSFTFTVNYSKW